jgi:hypothetical protein
MRASWMICAAIGSLRLDQNTATPLGARAIVARVRVGRPTMRDPASPGAIAKVGDL